MIVIDENGLQGVIAEGEEATSAEDNRLLVRFQNGPEVFVPSQMLIPHKDGRYYLPVDIQALLAEQENHGRYHLMHSATGDVTQEMTEGRRLIIPVIEEKVKVETRARPTGAVEIRKTVHERTEIIDQPLLSEEVEVERVAVNRFVDEPMPVRHEGDTMVIPLLEEVLVVEKRLLLREEVHVKTVRKEMHNPQEVLLREERVEVVRKPGVEQGEPQRPMQ
jgi:uncharacterized protein (TIGR02271 family)